MSRSRLLMAALAAISVGAASLLVWLAWITLKQDQSARLEIAADRIVQVLDRQLAEVGDRLALLASATADTNLQPVAIAGVSDSGTTVVFAPDLVRAIGPASTLVYYPVVPERTEPSPALFAEGETVEYTDRNPARAEAIYRRVAGSADTATRAAALLRLGRVLRANSRREEALTVYSDMATLDAAPVLGLPAALVARSARVDLLRQLSRLEDAQVEARALVADLEQGRWMLTEGQYAHYVEQAMGVAGSNGGPKSRAIVARAVSDLWAAWRTEPTPRGRRAIRLEGLPLLVVWQGTPDRLAVWVAEPRVLATRVHGALGVDVVFSDADGVVVGTSRDTPRAIRTAAESRLPWTLHVDRPLPASNGSGITQGQIVVVGLGLMVAFLMAGTYFIGRAVRREMELARLQTDFVSAVSHEFRTPLAAMRQLSELLAAGRVRKEDKRQQYYESLAGESRRLQRLVENLLNFGRLEAGARPYDLEPLDPRALVEQVVAEFRAELARPDCPIEIVEPGDEPRLMADRDAVALALHNLLDNAVKYSGEKPVRVTWARRGDRVALSVHDEGPGIAVDEQSRIFDKFVRGSSAATAKVRGTGVGLAMVQQIVVGHGGEVLLESEPGQGSTFTIVLPAARA